MFRRYPILVAGLGIRRWEFSRGGDIDYPEDQWKLWINDVPDDVRGPGPTHLQKYTKFGPGFLITKADDSLPWWKNCYHFWFVIKQQTPGKPGSEIAPYWRFGWWRWDAGDGQYIGPFTWYGPGLHWD